MSSKQKNHDFLPFALPDIGDEEKQEVLDCLDSGWLTTGPRTARLEADFRAYAGVDYALAVSSGTAGLHLALEALGVGPGDEVITTTYTFTATAEVVRYLGADPVLVDIDPRTLNLDPDLVEPALTERTKAIIPVHVGGLACEMGTIMELARERGLAVVEDAAHALPATSSRRMAGTIGDVGVYSFYATKPLATGEGGMVVTAGEDLARRMRTMRLHGIDRDVWDRNTSQKPRWWYEVVAPGFKYNLSDLMAAIGIHQLRRLESFRERREAIAHYYLERLAGLPMRLPALAPEGDIHCWHLFVLQLDLERLPMDRDDFLNRLFEEGIGASVHFIPLHLHPYWRENYGFSPHDFPRALDCFQRVVSLPIYSRMSDADVERTVEVVRKAII